MKNIYTKREDVARRAELREENRRVDFPTAEIYLHGPDIYGCELHGKAMMIACREKGGDRIDDYYLDKKMALALLDSAGKISPSPSLRPVVLSLEAALAAKEIEYRVDRRCLQPLLANIGVLREQLLAFQEKAEAAALPPKRFVPPAPEEMAALSKEVLSRARFDPPDIDLTGVDRGVLLALLYNNATTSGDGLPYARSADMTPREGTHILEELERIGERPHFDQLNGRSIKTWFDVAGGGNVIGFSRYWDYCYAPVAAMVALAVQGLSARPSDIVFSEYLDGAREICHRLTDAAGTEENKPSAAEIMKAMREHLAWTVSEERFQFWIEEQKLSFRDAMRPENLGRPYQISLTNSCRAEVGAFVKPFTLRRSLKLIKGGAALG